MLIIHGENHIQSRKALQNELEHAQRNGKDVTRLRAQHLTLAQLEEALGSTNLFGSDQVVVIEELHSLPTSARKKSLIQYLSQAHDVSIILWEKKALTKTMLKAFVDAQNKEYKLSSYIFTWLDLLGSSDKKKLLQAFHLALQQEDEHLCFILFVRQIRLLIQAKENTQIAGPPFMITKLKNQAQAISLEKLLSIHSKLLRIDYAIKTSTLRTTIAQELDLLQLSF